MPDITSPQHPEALTVEQTLQQAIAHHKAGQLQDAEHLYRNILKSVPSHPDANHNLGIIAVQVNQPTAGLPHFKIALEANPAQEQFTISYAEALLLTGQGKDALKFMQDAIQRGVNTPAFQALLQKIELATKEPQATEMETLVGLFNAGRYADMEKLAHTLVGQHPYSGLAWKALSAALQMQAKDDLHALQMAAKFLPDDAEVYNNLGIAFQNLERHHEAIASYLHAHKVQPYALQHAIHAHLLLPLISESNVAVKAWREHYQNGISTLMNTSGTVEDLGKNVRAISFPLAYQNANDRTMMEDLCRFFRTRLPELTFTSPYLSNWQPPASRKQRSRVGFVSAFLRDHTIAKLFQGFVERLDPSHFEVVLIHAHNAQSDKVSKELANLADKVLNLPSQLKDQQQLLLAENLDVLFYLDIGMTYSTYFLAYARLAPVQVVGWGHPDTTGIDTVDYFLSAASIEPENAEEHYTERLIRLHRLPCWYQPTATPAQIPDRETLGLPATGTLYGCPQSLFKFHPDFDEVLAAIANGDPKGKIVILEGKHSSWVKQLKARWSKTAPVLLERVLFLPRIPQDKFMALIAHMDVLLDPIHFGSGNTLYEAMVYGIPVVTWPGHFMRGRIVAGAYRQMQVGEAPIATRLEDYAPLALALGRDPERRKSLRQALLAAANRELFADIESVREFETFLRAAITAAGVGEILPIGWTPPIMAKKIE